MAGVRTRRTTHIDKCTDSDTPSKSNSNKWFPQIAIGKFHADTVPIHHLLGSIIIIVDAQFALAMNLPSSPECGMRPYYIWLCNDNIALAEYRKSIC